MKSWRSRSLSGLPQSAGGFSQWPVSSNSASKSSIWHSSSSVAKVGALVLRRIASTILWRRMPVSQVLTDDLPEKPAARLQRGDERVLHAVLGQLVVAQLQPRDAQQVAAMGVELGGEVGVAMGAALGAS